MKKTAQSQETVYKDRVSVNNGVCQCMYLLADVTQQCSVIHGALIVEFHYLLNHEAICFGKSLPSIVYFHVERNPVRRNCTYIRPLKGDKNTYIKLQVLVNVAISKVIQNAKCHGHVLTFKYRSMFAQENGKQISTRFLFHTVLDR